MEAFFFPHYRQGDEGFPDFKFVPGDAPDTHTLCIKKKTKTKLKKKKKHVIFWIIFSRKDCYISINIQSYLKETLLLSPEGNSQEAGMCNSFKATIGTHSLGK